jgi:hypothetical protein
MDQREPPRIIPAGGGPLDPPGASGPAPRRRLTRLARASELRRLSPQRLAATVAAALAVAAVGLLLLGRLAEGVRRFVHAQPAYQLRFVDITLNPPPPAWYRGGTRAFLERIAAGTDLPASFSTLDLDLKRLHLAFRRSPWVSGVRGMVRGTDRVVVSLTYREPVAFAVLDEAAKGRLASGPVIDSEAVILPREEVEWSAAGPLIPLHRFPAPDAARPGEAWSRPDPRDGQPSPDPGVRNAARAAGTLREGLRHEPTWDLARRPVYLLPYGESGVYVQVGTRKEALMFLWDEPDGTRPADAPDDRARWNLLRDFTRAHTPSPGSGPVYLKFTPGGVVPDSERSNPGRLARPVPGMGVREDRSVPCPVV